MADSQPPITAPLFDPLPKQSIGNYKGVMLCNRPDEFGNQRRPEPSGPLPFKSRVEPKTVNPVGWNPCPRTLPKTRKKPSMLAFTLARHREFLRNLEETKKREAEEMRLARQEEEAWTIKFKENAEK
jgi:hypothetical protein